MATIADQKGALEKWTPVIIFDVLLKDAVPRFWAKQAITFAGNPYAAIVLEHSELKIEGNGVYGVDAVTQISLTLNNADANLNSLITPANFQGGTIQPRFIFVAPDGTTTTDSIVYPKFLIDLPTATWPRVEFSAHNKWNLARKMLPVSLVTKKDRYPFPDTAAERATAGYDPGSEFYAIGYDPDTGKGNMKPGGGYYRRHEYDGTREKLKEMGLEVRYGGFGKVPPTIVGTPKKGEKADYIGNANEAKYGTAVPLLFGTCRTQPIVLDTGFPTAWNGSRLSHYLLSDGVNFPPDEGLMGIEDVLDVFIPDNPKYQRIPETSNEPQTTGAWSFQGGYYGSQKAPASSKYRNIIPATDFPTPAAEFPDRDLYSGLAYLEIGFPKELSGQDGIGPKLEAIVKGLKLETWDSGGNGTWQWTDNPVWIFVHLLKLLRWTTAEMDLTAIYNAAAYCDVVLANGKKRFRCNLPLTSQTRAADILRGIRNNCRMYTSFAADGKLQLKIAQNVAGEGGLAFALDNTNIMRGDDGQLLVEKFHRSVFETANIFSVTFQNEDNKYNADSFTRVDVANVNQIDEKVPADSIFPIIGIPSFDQAERQVEWARQEQVTLNEYYRVTCSLALIQAKVGQVGTITEARHALISQQVRIRAMAPGRDAGTVELTLQKHSDGAYTDQSVETPFTRAQADSSYTPRSVGGKTSASPAPILTEVTVADPINADTSVRRIKVEFKPPEQTYEGSFSRATKIRDVVVATSGGSIPGGQVLFVEVAPIKALARGLASEYLMVVVPSGGNSNSFSFTCELPPEADQYIAYVGNFPGQTYEQTVAASPGTAPFTVTIPNLARNFGSIPPDPAFDHVQIFYTYNSSPDVLRDGGRTFAPTESIVEFEPEAPAAEDTQVTVYVSSANAAEDDFYPINISPKATLTLTYENGPAQGWTATLLPGPTPSSVVAKFTRPTVNGKRLFWVAAQLKDSGTGAWRELDDNAGAAVTYYDGSGISHESIGGLKIKKDPGQPVGFGTAKVDDLIMLDVAGGSFDRDRCQWGTVEKFLDDLGAETTAANARYLAITGGLFRPQTTQDLRMKIVKPPHTWDTEGYLGNLTNESINGGVFWEWVGDREGDEFVLKPVEIGRDIGSVDVRFWIENDYCRSGGNGTHSTNAVRVRAARDDVIPGPVENLVVTGANGEFVAKWQDPLTGAATIDDVGIQYAEDAAFTVNVNTSQDWGDVNTLKGTDPGKTYYWRVAVHNLSDQPSHASTSATLGATGWGPWTAYGAPTAVSSGTGAGIPSDNFIPGFVQSLVVTGRNGEFIATWSDPATGATTIDDAAIQYCTDSAFTQNGAGSPAKGWGPVNTLRGTDPDKTYYWRVAVHNQSGLPSDSSTAVSLGATGWGPWTAYGAPTAVYSGLVPLDPVQYSDNLVYNGGFEILNGGYPDGWNVGQTAALGSWGSNEIHKEGNWGVLLTTQAGEGFSIYSKSFAVRPGERLLANVWAQSSGVGSDGFYFRLFYHANDPDWVPTGTTTATETYDDIFASTVIPYNEAFTNFEGQVTVPPGFYWCRVGLYNWVYEPAGTNYHFDDCQVVRIITGHEIDDNTIPAARLTGSARAEFVETFDEPLRIPPWSTLYDGLISYPASGVDGGKVMHVEDTLSIWSEQILIPFDPRKIYRLTCRVRLTYISIAEATQLFIGIGCYDNQKQHLTNVFCTANDLSTYPAWVDGAWRELTGWIKGRGTGGPQPAPDPTVPVAVHANTAYIAPQMVFNYPLPATGNHIEIDDYRIESFEEENYTSPAPNGSFSNTGVQSFYQYNDPLSSAASLWFTYTQGLVKADQFALAVSDGSASWIERFAVPAGQGGAWVIDLHRLNANRQYTCSITAEGFGAAGIVSGPVHNFSPFIPNGNYGSRVGTPIGSLDWAGGNVWYDSYQYRNNLPPTNGISGSIGATFLTHGSGGQYATITNIAYTQGSNIATHLAVLVRVNGGTIVLGQDMVVSYMSMVGLPSSYVVPLNLADNMTFTLGIAAVAECKNGRIFNTTFQPYSKLVNGVAILCPNTPADGYGRRVDIGHVSGGDIIKAYGNSGPGGGCEFHMYQGGTGYPGTKRAYVGGNSTAGYLSNANDIGIYVTQGGNGAANFGLGQAGSSNFGGMYNCLKFTNGGTYLGVPPVGGGMIAPYNGAGYWIGTSGTNTEIGPAGPHCERCGYDFWLLSVENTKWGAYLHICGWCGAVYKHGPKSVLKKLTKAQRKEIMRQGRGFIIGGEEKNVTPAKPRRSLRKRTTRRQGKRIQSRVRSARRGAV